MVGAPAVAAVVLVAVAGPAAALCKLNVNPTGPCVEWTPAALLTGPEVVLDAPFVTFRFLGGAVVHTRECEDCGTGAWLARGAGQALIALVYGPWTGFMDAATGFTAIVMGASSTGPSPIRLDSRCSRSGSSSSVTSVAPGDVPTRTND